MKSVKVLREPIDVLRTKNSSVAEGPVHPVEVIQDKHETNQTEGKLRMLAKIHGVHVPMRLKMDQTILAQQKRFPIPGLRPSFVGLETMLGKDETIEFEDYLSNPDFSEKEINIRAEVERSLEAPLRKN
eukprot:CAMPEP_0114516470 /NCGR_PEP_ID=MMETSP0109-20121206/17345_1 /TAXON_ID=29199 /ORGANISM="Chlorarachnion reptans, Strain CCCM449" /LENGTH=128 /DNA_ID=CAMNT_0001696861 /DNA_START=28 /DNA_END=414 /DNA_ORIENTATION=-